jgi:malonyl-CoA O-methyltransferase
MHELDQSQFQRACDQVAADFDANDFLCAEVRSRLFERLQLTALQPQTILDLGGGTGAALNELHTLYPDALLVNLDWSLPMLRQTSEQHAAVCADSHQLPVADASVDIVVSNMMLPNSADPVTIFTEARRVLRHPGLFLFSTLGPDSFKELHRAWAKVDSFPHVHAFVDMHNIGDALVQAGFREPVMDVEMLKINYRSAAKLVADLRAVAGTNFATARSRGLTTPRRWQQVIDKLTIADRLPITLEIITGQAWVGEPDLGVTLQDGVATFPLSQLK